MRDMHFVTMILIFCNTILVAPSHPCSAAPSARLTAALAGDAEAVKLGEYSRDLATAVSLVIHSAHPTGITIDDKIALEYVSGEIVPDVPSEIPAGKLGDQLDVVAKSVGYVLQANGDWLYFIPKSRVDDPSYIMNQRIPGTVVVSRDTAKATSIKEWLKTRHVSTARKLSGIRPNVPLQLGPDPIVLENPTLREHASAWESLFGSDRWRVEIEIIPAKDGNPERIGLLYWSMDTKAALKAAGLYPK